MLDDLNELKTFRAIMRDRSLSGAARTLGTSVAVVSKRLLSLEKRAGVRLFHRSTRAVSPTQEGERLHIDVERALDAITAGENWLANGKDEPNGTLRVSAPVSFGRRHVAPVLGKLSRDYEGLSVSLTLSDQLVDLVADGFDVAVRIGDPVDSSMTMRKLYANSRILVAAPSYLDAAGRPSSPADLHSHAFLRYGDATAPWKLNGPNSEPVKVAALSRLCVDNGDAIHDWGVAGHGIMLKSEIDVSEDLMLKRLERVLPGWSGGETPVIALFESSRQLPLKVRLFLDEMTSYIAKLDHRQDNGNV